MWARIRCIFIAMDVVSTIIRKFRDTAWIQIWEFLNSAILAHFLTHYHFSSEGRSRAISKSQWYYEYTPRELSNASTGTPYYRNLNAHISGKNNKQHSIQKSTGDRITGALREYSAGTLKYLFGLISFMPWRSPSFDFDDPAEQERSQHP